MDKEYLIRRLKSNYQYDFDFDSVLKHDIPERSDPIIINNELSVTLNSLTNLKVREFDDLKAARSGIRIIQYRDDSLRSVIALRFDPPCFDSGDRQYDSRRTLYFVCGSGYISAIYCVEGYEIAELYVLDKLTAASKEMIDYLSHAEYPTKQLKIL